MNHENIDKKNFDSVIFDVDGTLWDSTEICASSWSEYLQNEEHISMTITSDRLKGLFGMLLSDIAKELFVGYSEKEQLRIIDACNAAEHEALKHSCGILYEGLEDMLKELSKRYPLYIVSNCEGGYIELFLEATGFSHYFSGHLCPGDTGVAKAENIQKIARDNHLKAPVYVGDTMGDFNACQKAGVPFIFAAYGFGDVKEPYASIQKPMDLLEIL
jgi:phosphoglycolate phosphatase